MPCDLHCLTLGLRTAVRASVTSILLAVVAAQPAPSDVRTNAIGPMTVTIPAEWIPGTDNRPNAATYAIPGSAPSQQSIITLTAAPGNGEEQATAHRLIWAAYTNSLVRQKQQRTGQLGRFQWSEVNAPDRNQRDAWHRLYTSSWGGMHVAVLFVANTEQEFNRSLSSVERLLTGASFGNAAATGSGANTTGIPSRVTPPSADVPIVEAHVHVQVRAASLTSNVTTDHILFFANGIVAREGVITGPRECYALYDVRNLAKLPFNYGRWQEDKAAGIVRIQWQEGPPWTLQRTGNRLSLGGKNLLLLRPLDGLQLGGSYVYRPVGSAASQLDLRPDGQFAALNLIESMGCPMQARPGALSGSGSYEIRKWTLILRFLNGSVTTLPLYVEADQDLQRVTRFWLNGHDFNRAR
jgi:hypothetical protein